MNIDKLFILISIVFFHAHLLSSISDTTIKEGLKREGQEANIERSRVSFVKEEVLNLYIGNTAVTINKSYFKSNTLKKKVINSAILKLEALGFRLPDLYFTLSDNRDVRNVAYMGDEYGERKAQIFLGPKLSDLPEILSGTEDMIRGGLADKNSGGVRGVADQVADDDTGSRPKEEVKAEGVLIHELGHVLHELLKPQAFWKEKGAQTATSLKEYVAAQPDRVSQYAFDKQNALELVAEVFTGLVNGFSYPDETLKFYKQVGGPITPALETRIINKNPQWSNW